MDGVDASHLDEGVYVIYGWRDNICAHAHIGLICHL